jgi:hypothetical protein
MLRPEKEIAGKQEAKQQHEVNMKIYHSIIQKSEKTASSLDKKRKRCYPLFTKRQQLRPSFFPNEPNQH